MRSTARVDRRSSQVAVDLARIGGGDERHPVRRMSPSVMWTSSVQPMTLWASFFGCGECLRTTSRHSVHISAPRPAAYLVSLVPRVPQMSMTRRSARSSSKPPWTNSAYEPRAPAVNAPSGMLSGLDWSSPESWCIGSARLGRLVPVSVRLPPWPRTATRTRRRWSRRRCSGARRRRRPCRRATATPGRAGRAGREPVEARSTRGHEPVDQDRAGRSRSSRSSAVRADADPVARARPRSSTSRGAGTADRPRPSPQGRGPAAP